MADIVRVHLHTGLDRDYAATGFSLSSHGLTITRPRPDGAPGDEIVAVFDHGKFDWAERVAEGAAPIGELTPFDASQLGRASRRTAISSCPPGAGPALPWRVPYPLGHRGVAQPVARLLWEQEVPR